MRSDLGILIEKTRFRYNKPVYVISNGSFNPGLLRKFTPDKLKISLDYPDIRHDKLRVMPGLFENILRVIQVAKEEQIPIEFIYTATTQNISELQNMADLARKQGIRLNINRYIPNTDGDVLELSTEQLKKLFKSIKELKNKGYDVAYMGGLACLTEENKNGWCGAGLTKAHINGLGHITPCMFYNKKYGTIKESLKKVRKRMEDDRKTILEKEHICWKCPKYMDKCIGDCRAYADKVNQIEGICWEAKELKQTNTDSNSPVLRAKKIIEASNAKN